MILDTNFSFYMHAHTCPTHVCLHICEHIHTKKYHTYIPLKILLKYILYFFLRKILE